MSEPSGPLPWHWAGDRLILEIHVTPRGRRDGIDGLHGGRLRVRITAPPVDGKANEHLLGFLARTFGVPRRQVTLTAGRAGRLKRVEINAPARLPQELGAAGDQRP